MTTANYDLIAVPVLSESGHIMGVVTVDDVIDVMQDVQTEDIQKMGGMEALDEPYTSIGFWAMIRKRGVWLCLLFIGELLTASAMQSFEDELKRALVLSLFVPLIVSSGGNSGSQATSLIIRAMALGELTLKDWWRVALRELPTGLVLGAMRLPEELIPQSPTQFTMSVTGWKMEVARDASGQEQLMILSPSFRISL